MPNKFSATRFMQIAALALLAAGGLATAVHADDEYGTNHETLIRQVAASSGAVLTSVASSVPIASSRSDVVGAGGRQDDLACQTFQPGSGTDW